MAAAAVPVIALSVIPEVGKAIYAAMKPIKHSEDYGVFISCNLAASFGKLADHYKEMDKNMKVMIGVTIAHLNKIPERDFKGSGAWNKVIECLLNNPCLEPMNDSDVEKYECIAKAGRTWLASGITEPDRDSPEVLHAESWIKNLVNDNDVIENLSFDPVVYAKFVSCTGVALNKLETSHYVKKEKYLKSVVDIGVIRFPDLDNPYFKVYRLRLDAYRDCTHTFVVDFNSSGLQGEFHSRKFKIRKKIVKKMKKDAKAKAIAMVENLF